MALNLTPAQGYGPARQQQAKQRQRDLIFCRPHEAIDSAYGERCSQPRLFSKKRLNGSVS